MSFRHRFTIAAGRAARLALHMGSELRSLAAFLVWLTEPIWYAAVATAVAGVSLFVTAAGAAAFGVDPVAVVVGIPCLGSVLLLLGLCAENDRRFS